jgi:hypothetical protein
MTTPGRRKTPSPQASSTILVFPDEGIPLTKAPSAPLSRLLPLSGGVGFSNSEREREACGGAARAADRRNGVLGGSEARGARARGAETASGGHRRGNEDATRRSPPFSKRKTHLCDGTVAVSAGSAGCATLGTFHRT